MSQAVSSNRLAGKTLSLRNENAANCINPTFQAPSTPESLKKYRKSYKQQPGQTIIHPGLYDAPKPEGNFVYGAQTEYSQKVSELMQPTQQGINVLVNHIKEQQYASRHKEPLGQVPQRNYKWPEQTQNEDFKFGYQTKASEFSAKEIVFPPNPLRDTEENKKQYLRTHGNYEAGEQKQRNYEWQVDPDQHRFGKVDVRNQNQMKQVLQQDPTKDEFTKTTIIQKNQEDFKNYRDDPLGQPRNLAQVNHYVTGDTVFGGQKKKQEWGVGQCLRGEATNKEARPDYDLGMSTKNGFKNITKPGDQERVFGVPTIRNDIVRGGFKSVADPQVFVNFYRKNYGDEKPAIALLFPEKFSSMGLSEADFHELRPKLEIKSIFESIGFVYGIGKFEAIYIRAKQIQYQQRSEDDRVSVKAFQIAVQQMHHQD